MSGAACFAKTFQSIASKLLPSPPLSGSIGRKSGRSPRQIRRSRPSEIVFSAHSVPLSVIAKGDPYQRQIEETVELLMQRGGWRNPHRLCYQSKVGASKWLQPSLHTALRDLAVKGVNEVCVVPVSFVSDHVETLGEIDHEARGEAAELGIKQF